MTTQPRDPNLDAKLTGILFAGVVMPSAQVMQRNQAMQWRFVMGPTAGAVK